MLFLVLASTASSLSQTRKMAAAHRLLRAFDSELPHAISPARRRRSLRHVARTSLGKLLSHGVPIAISHRGLLDVPGKDDP
jgi:hypothetical protein